jgi:hypothetical protein
MEYDFFLCGEGIQLASESVQVTIDDGSASFCGSLENGMLDEMGYTAVVALFISGAAFNAQSAVGH